METVDTKEEIITQKNAVKIYLESLLGFPGASIEIDQDTEVSVTERLYSTLMLETSETNLYIKKPIWVTDYFSCLPIVCAGFKLLLPLRQVRTVMPMNFDIESRENLPEWMMSEWHNRNKTVKIIDMQKIVSQNIITLKQISIESHLVLIGDGKWGIRCDDVGKVVQLNQNDVQWRARKTKYRWVSGMSTKHQIAIIDLKRIEFAMALESQLV